MEMGVEPAFEVAPEAADIVTSTCSLMLHGPGFKLKRNLVKGILTSHAGKTFDNQFPA
jgi:predicted membrane protein